MKRTIFLRNTGLQTSITLTPLQNGIVGLPLAVCGIGINLFCIMILANARLRRVLFNQLLISLAVINIIALISRIIRILDKTFHMEVSYELLLLLVL